MAGKPKLMSQIKQLLQLHSQGKGHKTIAKSLGISKNTVKAYLGKVALLKIEIPDLLKLDDPVLESKFHAGTPAYKDLRFDHLKTSLDYFSKELHRVGVTKRLLWEEYRIGYPKGYGYTQFCHHIKQQLVARKPSMVLEHKAGEKLYIDFAGKMLSFIDKQTGEIISCPVFVACLPFSDYSFAMAVKSQSVEDFIYALRCCLESLGGVPQILVPDNLKAAIVKTSSYEPDINQVLDDFANHYKTCVVPARVAKPKDKALVENQVKLIYTRVFARLRNSQFFDLSSLNQGIREKVRDHNQTRMQQKPYCREEKFLSDELYLLQPLPQTSFEIKYYKQYKVAKNNHIYLAQDKHYYSVPYQWTGENVKIIYTRTMVYIYAKGSQIAVHPRDYRMGGYSTIIEHLCSHHKHYLDRSPEYYMKKAGEKSQILLQLIELLFKGGRPVEQNYRSCDGLFSLYRKTQTEIFNKACQMAIECKSYSYRFVLKIIENLTLEGLQDKKPEPLPTHQNIRGKDYYTQTTIKF
jgi:transposase